jgi:hypothetical protein
MATAAKATGFDVPCPLCGATNHEGPEGLSLNVGDLSLTCRACDGEVSVKDLERLVAETQRLIRWLGMAAEV